MNRNSGSHERQVIERIIMRLILLAMLCDRAVWAPAPTRALALSILRPGEIIARELAIGLACDLSFCPDMDAALDDDLPAFGSGPQDALALAVQFRVLAVMLNFMLRFLPHDEGINPFTVTFGTAQLSADTADSLTIFAAWMLISTAAMQAPVAPDTS